MSDMKPCLCCGTTQSGYQFGNDHYLRMVERLLESARMSLDQKSLLFIVDEISARFPRALSSSTYDETFGIWRDSGRLCGNKDSQAVWFKLLNKAVTYLNEVEEVYAAQ